MILVREEDGSFGFTFHNRIIGHLGNNSITSDSTALFELIKNSRDANASKVTIHFKDIGTQNAQIEIYDDGDGMSYEDVREKWMVIGTDDRLRNSTTRKGKAVWGEMGIGRLSCQKLGKKTVMISVKNNRKTRIEFDWSRYEKSGTTENVKFKPETGSASGMEKGVTLHLERLNSRWNTKRIADFKREVSILISKDNIDDTDVLVKIDRGTAERVGKSYAKNHEHVVNNAPFKVRIKFDGESLDVETLTQVGQRGVWQKQPIHGDFDDMEVGPFEASISHFPRSPSKQKGTTLENYIEHRIGAGGLMLEEFLRNSHGLYLYRDGAWMKPYGGSMDWLGLEAAARQATDKIGLKQIYGVIKMTKKKNPKIKPAAHRESLQENKAYRDLKKIMGAVFVMLKDYMGDWKDSEKKKRREEMQPGLGEKGTAFTLEEFEKRMKQFVAKLPKDQRPDAKSLLSGYTEISRMKDEEHEADIAGMGQIRDWEKNVATVGIAASYMAREVTKPLQDNMDLVAEADGMMKEQEKKGWKIDEKSIRRSYEMIETMRTNQTKMSHFMKFIDVLSQHIAQSVRNRKRATQVNVYECWKTVTDGFEERKTELGIKIDETYDNLTVKMDRIDLECILTHLYLNSIESLRRSKNKKKIVNFEYRHEDNSLKIKFADNGIGIPEKKLEEVFEPFKFGHSEDNPEKHGHGLGLHIVKKIMERYRGKVEAVKCDTGALFRIEFPGIKKVAT